MPENRYDSDTLAVRLARIGASYVLSRETQAVKLQNLSESAYRLLVAIIGYRSLFQNDPTVEQLKYLSGVNHDAIFNAGLARLVQEGILEVNRKLPMFDGYLFPKGEDQLDDDTDEEDRLLIDLTTEEPDPPPEPEDPE